MPGYGHLLAGRHRYSPGYPAASRRTLYLISYTPRIISCQWRRTAGASKHGPFRRLVGHHPMTLCCNMYVTIQRLSTLPAG